MSTLRKLRIGGPVTRKPRKTRRAHGLRPVDVGSWSDGVAGSYIAPVKHSAKLLRVNSKKRR